MLPLVPMLPLVETLVPMVSLVVPIIGKPNGVNSNIMVNTSRLFSYSIFYVYISIFLLFANIILIKTVLNCEIYKFKV